MNDYEVDYELIRETMVQFGERMESLGFPKILEDVEGAGKVGKCVRDPRDTERVLFIVKYLKGVGKDLLEEERELIQQGQIDPAIPQAKKALEECYQTLKLCVVDTQAPGQATDQRAAQLRAAQRVQPTMRVAPPQQRQALPAPVMTRAPVVLTPEQVAHLRAMQAAQAARAAGRPALIPSQVIPPRGR
jgi:hypothetical protein